MTSLQTPEASSIPNSNLANTENPAPRAPGQIDSSVGGNPIQDFDGEEQISVDDQWKIINAYFEQNGVVNQ